MRVRDGVRFRDMFRLDCGRDMFLEACHIERSALGWIEGSDDIIRSHLVENLPEIVRRNFPGEYYGLLIKPIPEHDLPAYIFMVSLVCYETVGVDPENDFSPLIVCWLGGDIQANLSELIAHEVRSVDWDKHAVNGSI